MARQGGHFCRLLTATRRKLTEASAGFHLKLIRRIQGQSYPRFGRICTCTEHISTLRNHFSACSCRRLQTGSRCRIRAERQCRGRFFNVVDLVNRLDAEARAERQGRMADAAARLDFVILDELGCPSVRPERGPAAVPPDQQALRAHVGGRDDEPRVRGVADRVRRCEDDDSLARPADAPLRDHRDRQRKLAVQEQIIGRPAGRPTAKAPPPDLRKKFMFTRCSGRHASRNIGCRRPPRCAPTQKKPTAPRPEKPAATRCPSPKKPSRWGVTFACRLGVIIGCLLTACRRAAAFEGCMAVVIFAVFAFRERYVVHLHCSVLFVSRCER